MKGYVHFKLIIQLLLLLSHFSRVRLCATPWTTAYQASLSMGFSRQEHWSGLPFPSPQLYFFSLSSSITCVYDKSLQSCPTLCKLMDCSLPGSSVHGISQARIVEWIAMLSSRRSSWPKDRTRVYLLCLFHLQVDSLPLAPPGKPSTFLNYHRKERNKCLFIEACWHQALHEDTLYSNTLWHFCPIESVFIFPVL